jgi:hypothetical protein
VAADDGDDGVEAGWRGEVFAHLGAPPLTVAFNAVFEALGEVGGVEVLGPSFAFE